MHPSSIKQVVILAALLICAIPPGCKGGKKKDGESRTPPAIVKAIEAIVPPRHEMQEIHDAGSARIRSIGLSADGSRWFVAASPPDAASDRGYLITDAGKKMEDVHAPTPSFAADAGVLGYYVAGEDGDDLVIERPDAPRERYGGNVVWFRILPDGSHFYLQLRKSDGRDVLYWDGAPLVEITYRGHEVTAASGHVLLVEDSQRLSRVVVNGEVGPAYDDIEQIVLADDGGCHAYVATSGEEDFVVFDGTEMEHHRSISGLAVSPDCSRLAYTTLELDPDGKTSTHVIVGGEKGPRHDWVSHLVFLPEEAGLAYLATEGDESFLVKDGKKVGDGYFRTGSLVRSADGTHLAFTGFEGKVVGSGRARHLEGECFLVRDGVPGERFSDLTFRACWHLEPNCAFSSDGSRLAWILERDPGQRVGDERTHVLVDGEMGPGYVDISDIRFLPGSDVLVYRILLFDKKITGLGSSTVRHRNAWVVRGKRGPLFDDVTDLAVDENGTRLRYLASEGSKVYLVTVEL